MTGGTEREAWAGERGLTWARRQEDLDLLTAASTALLIERADLPQGARVLDVGCGAGHSTLAAGRAVGPEGLAMGIDLSAALLEVARKRAAAEGVGSAAFVQGDAGEDQAPGAPFDAIISRFGTMFFDDPVAAFGNIARQLRPGAPLTMVAWAAAAENPWFALPHRLAEARLGPAPPGDPDAPGPTAFRDVGRVTGLLAQAGLRAAEGEACDLDLHHPGGPSALADLALDLGPAARLLRVKEASAADRAALGREIEGALAAFATPDGIRIPARVLVYRARAA